MTNRMITSLFFILAGLLLILIPNFIFPVCPFAIPKTLSLLHFNNESINQAIHSTKIMRCFWLSRAEMGLGIVIMVLGLILLMTKTIFIRLGVSLSLIVLAFLAAALPTLLIGVCTHPMMHCNMATKPALMLVSCFIFIIALINSIYLNRIANKSSPINF